MPPIPITTGTSTSAGTESVQNGRLDGRHVRTAVRISQERLGLFEGREDKFLPNFHPRGVCVDIEEIREPRELRFRYF